ncbi:MAG: TIM barrel protein [bacterium]|nr:TIM barrel protein [bacterium]
MKHSICLETIFTELPFHDRFEAASKAGFENVEFWSWEDKDISMIKDLCNQYALNVASFSGDKQFNLVDIKEHSEYIDFIQKSVDTAKQLDCHHLVIHSNALGDEGVVLNHFSGISKSKRLTDALNTLKKLKTIAEESKTVLVLEALNTVIDHVGNTLETTYETSDLIRKVNSDYIKILYDVYHMQINEGNIIHTIKNNIDTIDYIHVADVPGRHEPGTGEINYKNVFKSLKQIEYKGVIGYELFPLSNSDNAIDSIKKLINEVN